MPVLASRPSQVLQIVNTAAFAAPDRACVVCAVRVVLMCGSAGVQGVALLRNTSASSLDSCVLDIAGDTVRPHHSHGRADVIPEAAGTQGPAQRGGAGEGGAAGGRACAGTRPRGSGCDAGNTGWAAD